MSDRYLCKAKRTDNGEWVEGYYAFIDGVHYIYTGELCNGGLYVVAERFEVGPSTLCQCTGLHDGTKWEELSKKEQKQFLSEWNYEKERENQKEDWEGKKIWENDIVRYNFINALGKVVWIENEGRFAVDDVNDGIQWYDAEMWKEVEVIGSVIDNPELLEGGAD